ncbi:ABC transporter substrate-binding protein [Pseudoclavibacter chungangensis]|uniref:ABC transporter substrate-binding protein n=1 Tax=Pseudoclavibacter chungangensis TaxID=587635 RepID=A0A7J5BND9_9MICO|nr:ABC transporter substrate-binding protein [Pseudoclavibacter chungangensis]KAB1653606.1 ABC transporter substrate-binding protein [Pseudoclavibacter chungangensis]NYJ68709.1 peptide/nickel transport system substrate-binding protein [Pseudoclavibacter chungangensis]
MTRSRSTASDATSATSTDHPGGPNRRTRRRGLAVVATALAIALGASACTSTGADGAGSGEPVDGGTLSFAIASDLEGLLDPHSSQFDATSTALRNVFDSLVAVTPDGEVHPWLASSWTISEDGLEYVFQLRDDVTFHDGEPFDAAAAVANFDHIFAPETASAKIASDLGGDRFAGAEATGDHELTIRLSEPFAPLLSALSTTYAGMYSPAALAGHSQDELRAGGAGITVGSGPFSVADLLVGQELALTKNPDYAWPSDISANPGAAHLDGVTIRFIPEEAGRVGAVQSGETLVATDLTPKALEQIGRDAVTTQLTTAPGLPWSAILNWDRNALHPESGPGVFADVRVRQAFQLGIDLDAAVQAAFGGGLERPWSILSPTTPNAYDPAVEGTWAHDPARAEALLDEAGWTERDAEGYRVKDGQRLHIDWLKWIDGNEDKVALVNFLIEDLKQIGIELVYEETDAYADRWRVDGVNVYDWDITDWSFSSISADGALRSHLSTEGFQNASRVADPEIDRLLDEAVATTDPAEQAAIYAKIQEWNVQNVAIVPLFPLQTAVVMAPSVQGVQFDSFGRPDFQGAWITSA